MCILEISATISSSPLSIKKKLCGPFLWMGFNCLKAAEPLRGECLLFTLQFPGVPGIQLINLGRMKGWVDLGASQWFWVPNWTSSAVRNLQRQRFLLLLWEAKLLLLSALTVLVCLHFLFLLEKAENSQPIDKSKCFKKKIQLLRHVLLHF